MTTTTKKRFHEKKRRGEAGWRSPRASFFSSLLLVQTLLGPTGCSNEAKRETASLSAAVERWQRADGPQKAPAAADVRAVVCSDAAVVDAKAACVGAIDATAKALDLKHDVEVGLDDLEQKRLAPDDPRARELPKKLDDAERLLIEGRAGMSACDAKLLALRMKHGV